MGFFLNRTKPSMARAEAPQSLLIDGQHIPLVIRRSAQARRYRLSLDSAKGHLRLSLPARANLAKALAWAESHAPWIQTQLGRATPPLEIADGAIIPLEGQDVRICWRVEMPRKVERDGGLLLVGGPIDQLRPRVLRWLKARAKLLLEAETRAMARAAGLPLTAVGIGDPRSRWGSCSSSGMIRYSWRLILAPEAVRRATVAHEVAHLAHMDHSPRFHAFHAELLGEDPKPARAWLRTNGSRLHSVG